MGPMDVQGVEGIGGSYVLGDAYQSRLQPHPCREAYEKVNHGTSWGMRTVTE